MNRCLTQLVQPTLLRHLQESCWTILFHHLRRHQLRLHLLHHLLVTLRRRRHIHLELFLAKSHHSWLLEKAAAGRLRTTEHTWLRCAHCFDWHAALGLEQGFLGHTYVRSDGVIAILLLL